MKRPTGKTTYILFFLPVLAWSAFLLLTSCISTNEVPAATPAPPQVTPTPEIRNETVDSIERKILEIYEYQGKAALMLEEIEQKLPVILATVDACKEPVNRLQPWLFANTTIIPSDILPHRFSLVPCGYHEGNAALAAANAWNHLEYLRSLLREVEGAGALVERSCQDNGMSDQFKATVTSTLQGYRDLARQEITKLDTFRKDAESILIDYQNCLREQRI